MKVYSDKISVSLNKRGVMIIDTIMGCEAGMLAYENGCYGNCYSAHRAKIYGYEFSKSIKRIFKSKKHLSEIVNYINSHNTGFIRIGGSGDPSHDWTHTIDICEVLLKNLSTYQYDIFGSIKNPPKIVIVTKHWYNMTIEHMQRINKLGLYINTSVSAFDGKYLENRINQYMQLKNYCKSVLRVVTFDIIDTYYREIQDRLLKNENVIETVFRLVKPVSDITDHILSKKGLFMGNKMNISERAKGLYIGYCKTCPDKCGTVMC